MKTKLTPTQQELLEVIAEGEALSSKQALEGFSRTRLRNALPGLMEASLVRFEEHGEGHHLITLDEAGRQVLAAK